MDFDENLDVKSHGNCPNFDFCFVFQIRTPIYSFFQSYFKILFSEETNYTVGLVGFDDIMTTL